MAKKIAIIGGGIAGLTCAYYLNKCHNIKLFEKSDRLGGNAFSIDTKDAKAVDIAVAAFGKEGYGHFFALLEELGVETDFCANTFMSMHDLNTKEGLYLTPTLKGGITQAFDLIKLDHLKSIYGFFKGLKVANEKLDKGLLTGMTMGDCIKLIPQFDKNATLFLICVLCLLSSMSAAEVMETPASFFLGKLKVHNDIVSPKGLFSVEAAKGGTRTYIEAMAKTFQDKIVMCSEIKTLQRTESEITLVMKNGTMEKFDTVVFACNADQALALIENPTPLERELLGVWKYKEGEVIVHRDHSSFPARELIQAYTYLYTRDKDGQINTSVSGALRFEHQVPDDSDLISTQHPNFSIRKELIEFQTVLRTPKFSFESVAAIERMPSLNGQLNCYYCGSHFGYGLHNDAVFSAMRVANLLGAKTPERKDNKFKPSLKGFLKLASKLRG
ncbi:MAG: FAD-dependent oxidoreductase [Bdellovibrio sp.]|nr:FAD-dependent oxidoreductase [Bdellovibrio sp.]